jgi:hypothetical protein
MCSCNSNTAYDLPKGAGGAAGPKGDKGADGNTGPIGLTGATGAKGDTGANAFKLIVSIPDPLLVGSPTPEFVSAAVVANYITGNLAPSADGSATIDSDYNYKILRWDGVNYQDAIAEGSVVSVTISPAGVMTASLSGTSGIPTAYRDPYRIIITG